jgi:hypothetical protein
MANVFLRTKSSENIMCDIFGEAFYVDAASIARRLMWDQSKALEAFGIERDLLHAGLPAEGIQPLLKVMRANVAHLNELRAQVLARAQMAQVSTMNVP